jgi:putative tricarboxylic transport membrane protein
MLNTKRSGDMAAGALLALLGAVSLWASRGIAEGAGGQLHPRTFPMILSTLLVIGGAMLVFQAWRSRAGDEKRIDWPDRRGWRFWLGALASLALYVGLSPYLGFLICTFLFVMGFIKYFGRYSFWVAGGYAFGVVVFIYLMFMRLLELTLPLGPLSFLA